MISYENAVSQYEAEQQKLQEIINQDGVTSHTGPFYGAENSETTLYFTGGVKEAKLVAGTVVRNGDCDTHKWAVVFDDKGDVVHYSNEVRGNDGDAALVSGFVCNNNTGQGVQFSGKNGDRTVENKCKQYSVLNMVDIVNAEFAKMKEKAK